jgi:hypothetical protein
MAALFGARKVDTDVEFWHNPDRSGWLMKQGVCSGLPENESLRAW